MSVISEQVNAWTDEQWDLDITLREWWRRLADAGYSQPTWPSGIGGMAADSRTARTITEVLAAKGVIAAPTGMGPHMGGPTILEHGDDVQRSRLRAVADGSEAWCQLFSEPEAGSDLAGVKTTAIADGDRFVVSGQKVWNSSADLADWGMLLARTDPNASKHAGLTFFLIDMRQPGIEARPLRTMNYSAQFCEVFIDGATASAADVIGGLGNGWKVASTMLGHERRMAASGSSRALTANAGALGGNLDRCVREVLAEAKRKTSERPAAMVNSAKTLINLARDRGVADEPGMRDDLARYYIRSEVYRLTNLRARAGLAAGKPQGPEASIAKIALSGLARASRDLGLRIVGAGGMLVGPDSPTSGRVQYAALSTPGVSLGGGTDEIQRNVIAERALGLPRD
ncbi:MAG: putative acyl-CoA dehydrogenase [Ilumatobacteraceae bacterium]|nr:putative acyl-CoA dehydrogenase [Ilumatobacteraceae bacterium]